MADLKRTPLNGLHRRHGARFVDFAGWEMPVEYTGIIEEHLAVRQKAGLFDVSHMGEISVSGSEAEDFLDQMLTNDIRGMEEGMVLYTLMCYPDGGVVDDLFVYRLGAEDFLLCVNASNTEVDFKWLKDHELDECLVEDVSGSYGQLALQGPKAEEILGRIVKGVDLLKRFHFRKEDIGGVEVIVSRTGYTGEDGFELYCPWEKTEEIAELILKEGEGEGLVLVGLGARDSLRLEAGYPLYGHEISRSIGPLEALLEFVVKFEKVGDFIGKEELLRLKKEGPEGTVIFFTVDDRRIARQGDAIFHDEEQIGAVLSGTYSPCLKKGIGSAYVICNCFWEGCKMEVDIRGNRIPVLLVKPPFL